MSNPYQTLLQNHQDVSLLMLLFASLHCPSYSSMDTDMHNVLSFWGRLDKYFSIGSDWHVELSEQHSLDNKFLNCFYKVPFIFNDLK